MRTLKSIVVLALAAGLAVGGADVAKADPSDDPVDQALQAIEAVSPELLDDAINLTPEEGGDAAIEADIEDVQITVPTDPSDPLTFESDDGDIAIVLPASAEASDAVAARDGVVVFDNNDGSTTTPIVREDATLQINTVIQSPEAPVSYSYQIDLPVGTTIERDGESLYFLNGDTLVGGLAPAWAQDADGQTVTTRYEVDGSTVTQIVEHDATFTYPVVADPWLGKNLFAYVRNNVRAPYKNKPVYTMELSARGQLIYRGSAALGLVAPLGTGLPVTAFGYKIMTNNGWSEVISRQPRANTTSVKQQYVCHVRYGYPVLGSGWRWDLEAARPSYPGWTRGNLWNHRCNWKTASG